MKSIITGVGVVATRNGKIAMGLRRERVPSWSFPGGRLKYHERVTDCAVRELQEETGLTVSGLLHVFCVANIRSLEDGLHTVTFGVVADQCMGELTIREPEKCLAWEWFDLDDLPSNLFTPTRVVLQAWSNIGRAASRWDANGVDGVECFAWCG